MRTRALMLIGMLGLLIVASGGRAWAVDDQNCSDFATQQDAQNHLRADPSDPDGLDGPPGTATSGLPGVACEDNPPPRDFTNVYAQPPVTTAPPVATTAPPVTAPPVVATGQTAEVRIISETGPVAASVARSSTSRSGSLPATGPAPYAAAVGILGAGALLAGASMRGRRSPGHHWA